MAHWIAASLPAARDEVQGGVFVCIGHPIEKLEGSGLSIKGIDLLAAAP